MRDAYDAEYENRKDQDGKADMNGVRVRLVPREQRMKQVAARRRKVMEERGEIPERRYVPFYPFP